MEEYLNLNTKILIISDYDPDINNKERMANGVARVLFSLNKELQKKHEVVILHPFLKKDGKDLFKRASINKIYPGIEIAITTPRKLAQIILSYKPDSILIITPEGPMGMMGIKACRILNKKNLTMNSIEPTTVYTTNIEEYIKKYIKKFSHNLININSSLIRKVLPQIHKGSYTVMVHTEKAKDYLLLNKIKNSVVWSSGVDAVFFRMRNKNETNPYEKYSWYKNNPKPIYLYAGRVAPEKNLDAFLSLKLSDMHKVVIGEGPDKKLLINKYKNDKSIHFIDSLRGEEYAQHLRFAELFIFPSLTDTWGQVVTEAGASGVPVVSYDVMGSGEIIENNINGIKVNVDKSLGDGISSALKIDRKNCSEYVRHKYSWSQTAKILEENLKKIEWKVD